MIYLDHNATTPVLPEAVEAMLPWLSRQWGNPSSIHAAGRTARQMVEETRVKLAMWMGAAPHQVIFTSGATEANNAAIHSALLRQPEKRHIVTSAVEHSSVLAYCEHLEMHRGAEVTRLPVDDEGNLALADLRAAIRPDTALVSLMWANNETGVVWPVADFSQVCHEMGVPFHTDAVQAAGKLAVHFGNSGADFLSLSGHKFGAPKGVGALVVAEPDAFVPFHHGGKQEHGHRGGTENIAHIAALGAAVEACATRGSVPWEQIAGLRDTFEQQIRKRFADICVHGGQSNRLPNTSNLHFPGMDGDALVTFLDSRGLCVSSGSACLENAITPSHVIFAMSESHERASESIRVSLGLQSAEDDLDRLIEALEVFAAVCA